MTTTTEPNEGTPTDPIVDETDELTRPRFRLTSIVVQVEGVIDDGTHLTPVGPIDPARIPAKDWPAWVAHGLPASVALIEQQLGLEAS